jgi:histidinol-phosphate aminotransferase
MTMVLEQLFRSDIAALRPYTPIVPLDVLAARLNLPIDQIIKLDANENPYGPSPKALAALVDTAATLPATYAIYPDPEHTALRQALSGYTGLPASQIICGAGSDELIDLLMRLCLQPGDAIVDCQPTFGMYAFDASLHAARVVNVPRDHDFELDLAGIAAAVEQHHAKMVFVAAPNNPTGNPLARPALERLLELPTLLVVDEAYYEFHGETAADLVGRHPNLVVLRTFSKWAGLAGLRVGYALANQEILQHLWKIKQPYNVNVAADLAAVASLEDVAHLQTSVTQIVAERERMFAAFSDFERLVAFPSQANFVLMRVLPPGVAKTNEPGQRGSPEHARRLYDELAQRGILIRYYSKPELADCVRISIGTPAQNECVLAALAELLRK